MKKILLSILVILTLCGCSQDSKLKDLGYSEDEIILINALNEDAQMLFYDNYNNKALEIIKHPGFNVEKFSLYLKYYDYCDLDFLFELVNENSANIDKIIEIRKDPYYMEKNKDLYLKYYDEFTKVRDLVEFVNVQRYDKYYDNEKPTDTSKDYLMLINKYNYLDENYEPDDLVKVDDSIGWGYLREAVYDAYLKLRQDGLKEGYDLRVVSPYRDYETQYVIYHRYLNTDSQEVVDTYSARPGHSEHQSGLCIDLSVPGYSLDDFYLTDASVWLKQNCYKYGFIIRYPEGKDNVTGFIWEPWQVRYVGDQAEKIYQSGLTFDEYYAYYIDN